MPMTAAHPMAVLPLRRLKLDWTCLVIGSMAPDFEYFFRVKLASNISHTLHGLVYFCLPVTLLSALLWHRVMKDPFVRVVPARLGRRLAVFAARPWMPTWNAEAIMLMTVSALIGAATHLFWDGFTHADAWGPQHIAWLRTMVPMPVVGEMLLHRVLQHTSTLIGLVVLGIVATRTLRRVVPVDLPPTPLRTRLVWIACIAVVGAATFFRIHHAHELDPGSIIVAIIDAGIGGAILASLFTRD